MRFVKLIVGMVLAVIGIIILFWSLQSERLSHYSGGVPSKDFRVEFLEKRNHTYVLSQCFLLKNPFNSTMSDLVYTWLPVNASNQFVKLIETKIEPLHKKSGEDGVEMLVFNITIPAGETTWINMTLQVTVESYNVLIENAPWLPFSEVEENTGGKRYWAVENETYVSLAKEICLNARDPISASRAIGKWIVDNKIYEPMLRKGAEQALIIEDGRLKVYGDCEEVADVFVTLTRILGIRSRVVHGIYLLEDKEVVTMWIRMSDQGLELSDNWGGHAWPQIYVPQVGWVDVELLEGDVAKIGDFSKHHIKYGFEEKSFLGSTVSYCRAMFLETNALYFTFRRVGS
ncbi:MAG: transglutaminase-like domain-containing protein [Thermoproteota archaeon]